MEELLGGVVAVLVSDLGDLRYLQMEDSWELRC